MEDPESDPNKLTIEGRKMLRCYGISGNEYNKDDFYRHGKPFYNACYIDC